MTAAPIAVLSAGLVTSVGLTAPAACAAIRAKITNPSETAFTGSGGESIMGHQVQLDETWRGLPKLAKMTAIAIDEVMANIAKSDWPKIPLLLCVSEKERPGRPEGIDDRLLPDIEGELGTRFARPSQVIARGRVGVALAISQARALIQAHQLSRVLIAATDSLLTWPTLRHYERGGRLLTGRNSNGFMPGEGSGAILIGKPTQQSRLVCRGLGFAVEKAHVDSDEPLRGDGLTQAIKAALTESGCEMHDLDYRITDLSGEQYYFKEAALALNRTLRRRKEEFELWHPAESCGEAGALAGATCVSVALMASTKGYAPGPGALLHFANDSGDRAALVIAEER